jgi:hypothetical protein
MIRNARAAHLGKIRNALGRAATDQRPMPAGERRFRNRLPVELRLGSMAGTHRYAIIFATRFRPLNPEPRRRPRVFACSRCFPVWTKTADCLSMLAGMVTDESACFLRNSTIGGEARRGCLAR